MKWNLFDENLIIFLLEFVGNLGEMEKKMYHIWGLRLPCV